MNLHVSDAPNNCWCCEGVSREVCPFFTDFLAWLAVRLLLWLPAHALQLPCQYLRCLLTQGYPSTAPWRLGGANIFYAHAIPMNGTGNSVIRMLLHAPLHIGTHLCLPTLLRGGQCTSPALFSTALCYLFSFPSRLRYTLFLLLHDCWMNSVIRFDVAVPHYLDGCLSHFSCLPLCTDGFSAMLLRRVSIRLIPHSLILTWNCLLVYLRLTTCYDGLNDTRCSCAITNFPCQTYFALSVAALLIFPLQR